jgi:hypothetical protein
MHAGVELSPTAQCQKTRHFELPMCDLRLTHLNITCQVNGHGGASSAPSQQKECEKAVLKATSMYHPPDGDVLATLPPPMSMVLRPVRTHSTCIVPVHGNVALLVSGNGCLADREGLL